MLLLGAAEPADADVVLNEVNCEGTDWIELVNTSGADADISGWLLTDDPITSDRADHRLIFPGGTVISAGDDLVVEKGAGGFPFGVSCGNDTIRLADATPTVVDEESIPALTSATDTWGRFPNGTGDWTQTASTKGSLNQPSSASGDPDEDLAAPIFDPTTVYQIDLTLPQTSIDALAVDPEEYQDGTFAFRTPAGTYGPMDVGVRLKGHAVQSRDLSQKAAFKVKFAHSVAGQRFLGLKNLTLNNMVGDPSEIHETLAYQAFRAAGIAAPRTGFSYVRVNGADYGVYLTLATVDNILLRRWFDSTQHLYEGELGADAVPGKAGQFDVDEGSESDLGDIEALIDAADDPGPGYLDRMRPLADIEQMTRMWAIEKYIGHWDSYSGGNWSPFHPNNYFLHSDAGGRFTMVPWGTDMTWDSRLAFDNGGGRLFNRCVDDPACFEMYIDAVHQVSAVISTLDLDARAVAAASLLDPWQRLDPRTPFTTEQVADGVSDARAFIAERPGHIDSQTFWYVRDLTPPQTYVTAGPPRAVRTRRRRARVGLSFISNEQRSSYECKLDRRPWSSCYPPITYRVGRGRHRFMVRARDPAGYLDGTPAIRTWRVKRRR